MKQIKATDAFLNVLRREGVEYIFGIPGATEVKLMDALEDHSEFKYILCLHELAAVGAAEGYARASDKTGFLFLHTGTGLAASLPMLSNAYYGGVPLVVTAGQQDTRLLASEPAMSDNLVKIASPFVKWGTELRHAAELPMIMNRAFKVAASPPTGPVFVSLPADIINDQLEYEFAHGSTLYNNFHPDDDSITAAVELLSGAKNPAIIVEDGVARDRSLAEVVKLAEQIGARVYQPWMADVNFPVNHPQYLYDINVNSPATRDILAKVDVLTVIGALFFSQAVYVRESLVPQTTKVIQIDSNPWQIGKNIPVACGMYGNIKVALSDLSMELEKHMNVDMREDVRARIGKIYLEKQVMISAFEAEALKHRESMPIHATRLMQEIRDAIAPGTRIVDDCWSYSAILRRTVPFAEEKAYMRSRGGGSIGWGLPGAIGVKLAAPERPVVCISGDGSAMWSIQSLWTAARYNVPVTFIVISNGCYRQVRLMKKILMGEKVTGRNLGTDLCLPANDFCKIAEGMGITAQKLERPEDIRETLKKALSLNKPNLIDVTVDATLS
ncbi:MAG: thiamine pyrophosphate-binding protein [Deltaproteobacteria bacterium]|nr:thiamine pyrophosphate-binding protein [Deltaproteobacteria bacterium]